MSVEWQYSLAVLVQVVGGHSPAHLREVLLIGMNQRGRVCMCCHFAGAFERALVVLPRGFVAISSCQWVRSDAGLSSLTKAEDLISLLNSNASS